MKAITKCTDGTWSLSSRSHLEGFSLAGVKKQPFAWPKELAGEKPSSTRKLIGILGRIAEWMGEDQIRIPGDIEVDSLWRLKPAATMGGLISACYLAEGSERNRRWAGNLGNPYPNTGRGRWVSTNTGCQGDQSNKGSRTSWGKFRTGRCENSGVENKRCGPLREN